MPKYTQGLLVAMILIVLFTHCSNENSNLSMILETIEETTEQHPDSAMKLLESVKDIDNLTIEQYNYYNLLWIQAKDKMHKDISSDTIIFKIKDYYIKENKINKAALSTYYSGRVLHKKGKNKAAISEYLAAECDAKKTGNSKLLGLINYSIGMVSLEQPLSNEAINHLSKAIKYFRESNDTRNEISALNQIGNAHLKRLNNDSAFYYYNEAKHLAELTRDTLELATLAQCIGVVHVQLGNFNQAKANLKESTLLFENNKIKQAVVYLNLANVFQKENQIDSAKYYIKKSLSIQEQQKDNSRLLCASYLTLSKIEEDSHHYQAALSYYKKYNEYLITVYNDDNNAEIIELQKKYQFETVLNENNKLVLQRQQAIIVFSIILLIIGLAALFFIIKSFRIKKATLIVEKNVIEAEKKIYQLMEIAQNYDKKENTFRNILLHHFNILKKAALLEQYTRGDKEQDLRLIKLFNEIVYEQESLNWSMLYKTMNELHNGFFDRLKKQYPQLEEQEFRICCLTYEKFSSSEIALIMELKINTIQMKRSSIRKKMGIEPLGNISDFLDNQLNSQNQ